MTKIERKQAPTTSPWEVNRQRILAEIEKFPVTFGLRAFPGKTFKINFEASYISEGRVYLYTYIKNANGWESFCKGTAADLSAQVVTQ